MQVNYLFLFFYFLKKKPILHVCVCLWECRCEYKHHLSPGRVLDSLRLEVQTVVSFSLWVLRLQLSFFGKSGHTHNHSASQAQKLWILMTNEMWEYKYHQIIFANYTNDSIPNQVIFICQIKQLGYFLENISRRHQHLTFGKWQHF